MYKEYTRPLEQQIDTDKNIFSVLDERANRTPNDSLVEYKNEHGEWSSFSATEFRAKVIAIAKGLIAQGIMPGESVSIISHTCWQWTALDVAIMSIGALTVPVYETNSPAQVKMIFNDANVKMAFAEDDAQRDKIESIRNECSNLGDVYVIGLGAIGRRIAQIARAFGANVIYYSASGRPAQDGYTQVDFDTLLTTSDIISVHAPLNEHTENLLDKCAFAKMKETCIFLNLGRGPIVVEQDLYDALVNGEIAAAGLDVLSAEPMSEKNPLIKIQDSRRLFITPHIAWASVEARARLMQIILDQVKEYFHM